MSILFDANFLLGILWLLLSTSRTSSFTRYSRNHPSRCRLKDKKTDEEFPGATESTICHNSNRRSFLFTCGITTTGLGGSKEASADVLDFLNSNKKSSLYLIKPISDSLLREPVKIQKYLCSEVCLLQLLPIKNQFFRSLEKSVSGLSSLRSTVSEFEPWERAEQSMNSTLDELDKKRSMLEPVFNPDEDTIPQSTKEERGKKLIESFRDCLVELVRATSHRNATRTFAVQRDALLRLADIGELLVAKFPYKIPEEGKFSYLPRLLGRTKVTFSFRRRNQIVGNVTIVADGYTAPITAGNFVDLSVRNFYTGLPLKVARKRLGKGSEFEVASVPILGSYMEGFYDPLTAKLRRIPLEIIRFEQDTPKMSYAEDISNRFGSSVSTALVQGSSKPLLSFKIPGLVALNHPDNNLNGGSADFFGLQKDSLLDEKKNYLDGEYAPFGFIVDGYDVFEKLRPGDIIENTQVDDWGLHYLVKLRRSSFSEVVQSSDEKPKEKPEATSEKEVEEKDT